MRNYIVGLLTGIGAGCMYFGDVSWYLWIFFIAGSGLVALGTDVFFGSLEEHQPRAAWVGLTMFGGSGVFLYYMVLKIGF